MTTIDESTLIEYALDTLDPEERDRVDKALRHDPSLQAALSTLMESLGNIGAGDVQPAPSRLRDDVVASVSGSSAGFRRRLAALFGLDEQRAGHYLDLIPRAPHPPWQETRFAGVFTLPVADARCPERAFLVYQSPGHTVPWHRHRGRETVLVIDGYGVESGGENLSPGSMVQSDETVVHQLVFDLEAPCCYAVRLDGALDYVDAPTPSDEEQP